MPMALLLLLRTARNVDERAEVEFLSVGIRDIAVGKIS
jgi:hypothetical protein